MSAVAVLLGGLGLFLLGMRLMTEGLKLAAGEALRSLLRSWTNSPARGLVAGALITAVVQSSSAVTVAVIGFVNAGLLSLAQAVWVVFGSNVGTTMTGWLVALVGVKLDVPALALPLLGAGMLARLAAGQRVRLGGAGEAIAGFGAFFLGVGFLQSAFADLATQVGPLAAYPVNAVTVLLAVGVGTALTVLTQSSSAAIAITLTASAAGAAPLMLGAAVVVGTNIGTTSTALLAALGATPPARRVATAHVAFNLLSAGVALAALPALLPASEAVAAALGLSGDQPATLAIFHTLFNLIGVALMAVVAPRLVRRLASLFVTPAEDVGRPRQLDANLLAVPALAVRGLVLELARMRDIVFDLLERRVGARSPEPKDAALRQGVLMLAGSVREFVSALNTRPLPAGVVEPLPDLLRALQHLEDLAALWSELAGPSPPADPHLSAAVERLRSSVVEILARPHSPAPAEASGEEAEQAYQQLKARLLRMTAEGALTPRAMEAYLAQAQALRRCGEVVIKTRRRLDRWVAELGAEPAD